MKEQSAINSSKIKKTITHPVIGSGLVILTIGLTIGFNLLKIEAKPLKNSYNQEEIPNQKNHKDFQVETQAVLSIQNNHSNTAKQRFNEITSSIYDKLLFKNIDQLILAISKIDHQQDGKGRFLLFANLSELLKHRPDLCFDLEKAVMAIEQDHHSSDESYSRQISILIGALASAPSPEAEIVLTRLIGQKLKPRIAIQAVIMINNYAAPTHLTVDALADVLQNEELDSELVTTGRLAYGSLASILKPDHKKLQDKVLSDILTEAQKGNIDDAAQNLFGAIGNTANPIFLDLITQSLTAPNPKTRARGLIALRAIPGKRASAMMAKALTEEQDISVLKKGVKALRYRPIDPLFHEALQETILNHEDKPEIIALALKSSLLNAKSKTNQLRGFQDTLAKIQAKVQKRSTMLMTQSVINQIKKQHQLSPSSNF